MEKKHEIRTITTNLRADAASGDGGPKISGYAASFNTLSARLPALGGARERLSPGCFTDSLRRGDEVACYLNHDRNVVLGRTRNNTLQLREDSYGLHFSCVLPNTQAARDIYALIQRGDIGDCSFGFRDAADDWANETDPDTGSRWVVRTVRKVSLFDVSVVAEPAYPEGTSVNARNLRSTDYSIRLASAADVEAEKKIWRDAFDLQMKRDGF